MWKRSDHIDRRLGKSSPGKENEASSKTDIFIMTSSRIERKKASGNSLDSEEKRHPGFKGK